MSGRKGKKASFLLTSGVGFGTVVRENRLTVWVKLTSDGNVIKRHKRKHRVAIGPK